MPDTWMIIGLSLLAGFIGGKLSKKGERRSTDTSGSLETLTASNVIATGEFLLAKDGKVRARLGLSQKDGTPFLSLLDEQEKVRVGLTAADKSISGLLLSDRNGKARILIGVDDKDACRLLIRDNNEKVRGSLILDTDGLIHLKLCDMHGRTRAMLTVADDGAPGIILMDDTGDARMAIAGLDEKVLWEAP